MDPLEVIQKTLSGSTVHSVEIRAQIVLVKQAGFNPSSSSDCANQVSPGAQRAGERRAAGSSGLKPTMKVTVK